MAEVVKTERRRRSDKGLRGAIAVAISVIAIGCSAGLFIVDQQSADRSTYNGCVLKVYLDESIKEVPKAQLKMPGAKKQIQMANALKDKLKPPISECKTILKDQTGK